MLLACMFLYTLFLYKKNVYKCSAQKLFSHLRSIMFLSFPDLQIDEMRIMRKDGFILSENIGECVKTDLY